VILDYSDKKQKWICGSKKPQIYKKTNKNCSLFFKKKNLVILEYSNKITMKPRNFLQT
jgi:hypothetical protein